MKFLKSFLIKYSISFLFAWFLLTIFIDIFAVPVVFRNSSSLIDAGKIGMNIFSNFNSFELLLSTLFFISLFVETKKNRIILFFGIILLIYPIFYKFYMTPLIANNSIKMHSLSITSPDYEILMLNNKKYHEIYKYFDVTKLLILIFVQVLVFKFQKIKGEL